MNENWNGELAEWRNRPLDDLEVVYMWVDGVYVKAGLEREKAAIATLSDGSKVVLSAVPVYRESAGSWSDVLRDIKHRGLNCPSLWWLGTDILASGERFATSIPRRQSSLAGTTRS